MIEVAALMVVGLVLTVSVLGFAVHVLWRLLVVGLLLAGLRLVWRVLRGGGVS